MTTVLATLALTAALASEKADISIAQTPAAQTVDAAAGIRQRVKEGQKVRVTDDQGQEWQGRIATLSDASLVLVSKDRQQRNVPYASVVRIDRPPDTLGNGALIGFLSGAAFGLAAVIDEEFSECEPGAFLSCGDPIAAAYLVIPAITGGIGAGIGVGIDALIRKDPTLFRRGDARVTLAPSLGRGVRGLSLSVRW